MNKENVIELTKGKSLGRKRAERRGDHPFHWVHVPRRGEVCNAMLKGPKIPKPPRWEAGASHHRCVGCGTEKEIKKKTR